MTADLLIASLAILSFFQLGLILHYYFLNGRILRFDLAVFFGLGLGFVAIVQTAGGIFEISISRFVVILISIIFFLPLFFDRQLKVQLRVLLKNPFKKVRLAHKITFLIILGLGTLVGMAAFSHQVWGYDALARWIAKANSFWIDGGMFRSNVFVYQPVDDFNLWPLSASWFFHFIGKSSDFWVQIIPFTVYLGMIFEFAKRTAASGKMMIFWVCLLAFTPFLVRTVIDKSYSGNADLLVSFYFLLAFGALFYRKLVIAAIFLGFSAMTKNDAMPALFGFIVFVPLLAILSREKLPRAAILVAFALLFIIIGWKMYYGLESRYLESDINMILEKRPIFEYTKYSLQSFREEFRQINHWGIGFLVIIFFLVTRFRKIFADMWLLCGVILFGAQFLGYILVYYVTPEDQASQIATSIYRVVLQVYPSLLLLAYVVSASDEARFRSLREKT